MLRRSSSQRLSNSLNLTASRIPLIAIVTLMMMATLGCSPQGSATFTLIPTQTLIPSTPTSTPPIPTATPTLPPPLLVADLATNIPVPLLTLTAPAEMRIAQLALDDLLQTTRLTPELTRLAHLQAMTWPDAALGCDDYAPGDSGSVGQAQAVRGYWLVFVAGNSVYEYHTDMGESLRLCATTDVREAQAGLLILIDPVAAELVALARRRLASTLDLPSRRVQLIAAQVITWPDTSLGCPAAGRSYETLDVEGYRIVMAAGDEEYIFHTNFERLVLCDPENEVLP